MTKIIECMEAGNRKNRDELDRDVEFSHAIKAGKRIYYMDVRRTRKDDLYLSITESKKIAPADGSNTVPSFEKHKIFLYREDFSKFIEGLSKAIGYIHENQPVWQEVSEDSASTVSPAAADSEYSSDKSTGPEEDDIQLEELKIDF